MKRNHIPLVSLLFIVLFVSGCTTFPRYQRITDGLDRKQYQVAGRVMNSFQKPVADCQIYLTRQWPLQHIPVAISDRDGDFSFVFERDGATEFFIYFDARSQGYKSRYINITHLFTSQMFQYTGSNPVIVNAILLPDKLEVQSDIP